jgi:hypothetical protein
MAIVTTNAWNRIAISTRAAPKKPAGQRRMRNASPVGSLIFTTAKLGRRDRKASEQIKTVVRRRFEEVFDEGKTPTRRHDTAHLLTASTHDYVG